jgi:hypothetical protein
MRELKPALTVARAWADVTYSSFTDSLAEMLLYTQHYLTNVEDLCSGNTLIHYDKGDASYHELMRNGVAERMQGEMLFFLDTDHQFAPDVLIRLLRLRKKYKAKVISGIYQYKWPGNHAPVANFWGENNRVQPLVDWDRDAEIMEIGAVGAGCLLIDREVLKRIEHTYKTGPFTLVPGLSEDYSFCLRCKELGIPIHLALQVECHHLIRTPLHISDYRPVRDGLIQTTVKGG